MAAAAAAGAAAKAVSRGQGRAVSGRRQVGARGAHLRAPQAVRAAPPPQGPRAASGRGARASGVPVPGRSPFLGSPNRPHRPLRRLSSQVPLTPLRSTPHICLRHLLGGWFPAPPNLPRSPPDNPILAPLTLPGLSRSLLLQFPYAFPETLLGLRNRPRRTTPRSGPSPPSSSSFQKYSPRPLLRYSSNMCQMSSPGASLGNPKTFLHSLPQIPSRPDISGISPRD